MKKFLGTIQKERFLQWKNGMVEIAAVLILVYIFPLFLDKLEFVIPESTNRLTMVVVAFFVVIMSAIIRFYSSLRKDMKIKDLWLNSQLSVSSLVFAKYIYHLLQMFLTGIIVGTGLLFVGDRVIQATGIEWFVLTVSILFILFVIYSYSVLVVLFFYTLFRWLYGYIAKYSIIVTILAVILIFKVLDFMPSVLLPYGKISYDWWLNLMPTLPDGFLVMGESYVVDDLLTLLIAVMIFIVSCKWLEGVLAR